MGYEKCLREWPLGISASRAAWAVDWMSRTIKARKVNTAELREALGRLVFVYGALTYDKPFLGPLFAFLKVHWLGLTKRLPLYVLIVLSWLRDRLKGRRATRCWCEKKQCSGRS